MNIFKRTPAKVPAPEDCLPGRNTPIPTSSVHFVNGRSIKPPFPENMKSIVFGMGCFWGAERLFWELPGVYTTAAGYSGGTTPNPTYEETCTSRTGHTEAVLVVFDPNEVGLETLFKVFWENHDPTQYMGQGNDTGSQYRSAIYATNDAQREAAAVSRDHYQSELQTSGFGEIETEIAMAGEFYYAEELHQQYLAKNPLGYCNHGFCQVAYS
ncbi:MAG: peptide-methionine (S)-S-oxide reductase MsrA [Chloroflexi bacterium]|nr:peptide-methionine (S)-S-oxide reductase MsrA [Chloroflexota bacterium]